MCFVVLLLILPTERPLPSILAGTSGVAVFLASIVTLLAPVHPIVRAKAAPGLSMSMNRSSRATRTLSRVTVPHGIDLAIAPRGHRRARDEDGR